MARLAGLLERAMLACVIAAAGGSIEFERALEAGEALLAAKKLVRHGEWATTLAKIGIPQSTAALYMALARNRERIEAAGCTSVRQARDLISDRQPPAPRQSIRAWTISQDEAYERGYHQGYKVGYAAGYRAGKADGVAAAPSGVQSDAAPPRTRDLLWLISLAHPDKHQDAAVVQKATRVTQWLNALRYRANTAA